jgi:hypothetical protein
MKTLAVRGLDGTLTANLKLMAKQVGQSVNHFILDMLKERLGLKKEKKSLLFTTTWTGIFSTYLA